MRFILIILVILIFSIGIIPIGNNIYAQWTQTSGPGNAGINILYQSSSILYAGTIGKGIYKSLNNGLSWQAANNGMSNVTVKSIAENSSFLFAGVEYDNLGNSGVYRSSDNGNNWTLVNSGIENSTVSSLYADNSVLLAGTIGTSVYRSTDNGNSWIQSSNGLGNQSIKAIVKNNNLFYLAGDNNLYYSSDGIDWFFTNGGQYFLIFCLGVKNNYMYAGGFQGLIRSSDYGATWSERIDILQIGSGSYVSSFTFSGSTVFASVSSSPFSYSGVMKSTNNGLNWSFVNNGIEIVSVNSITFSGSNLIAGTPDKGIILSSNSGTSWIKSNTGLAYGGGVRVVENLNNDIFAGTSGDGIYKTTDNGGTWVQLINDNNGFLKNETVHDITAINNIIFAGTGSHGIYKSTNGGNNWTQSNTGLPDSVLILCMTTAGTNVLAGTSGGIFLSSNNGLSWNFTTIFDEDIEDMTSSNGFSYAIVYTGFFTSTGIYRSSNNGQSWSLILQQGANYPNTLASRGSNVYLGDLLSGIIKSTNNGAGWTSISIGADIPGFAILPLNNNSLFVGSMTSTQEIYYSSNDGSSWSAVNQGFSQNTSVEALGANQNFIFAGTNDKGVWKRAINEIVNVVRLNLTSLIEGFWNGSSMISDTTNIFLRNSTSPYAKIDSSKAKLNTSGNGLFYFNHAANGSYYIEVTHRNSIETWSMLPQSFNIDSVKNYDFTTAANKAFGNNLILKGGKYCIYSGDVNQEGSVDGSDLSLIDNASLIFLAGYNVEDVNGDQIVDGSDASICDNNAFNFVNKIVP